MTTLEKIRAKCIEASPDKRFGCGYPCDCPTGPIRLADVLLAIVAANPANRTNVLVEAGGLIGRHGWQEGKHRFLDGAEWNLRNDDLWEQSPETVEFIGKTLGV